MRSELIGLQSRMDSTVQELNELHDKITSANRTIIVKLAARVCRRECQWNSLAIGDRIMASEAAAGDSFPSPQLIAARALKFQREQLAYRLGPHLHRF